MLRGTVYLVFDPEAEPRQRIERTIVELDVETAAEFRLRVPEALVSPLEAGAAIEFGPIGPSWGMTG